MRSRIFAPLLAVAMLATSAPLLHAGPKDAESPAYLGVRLQRVEGGLAEALDLEADAGVLLGQVMEDGPAAEAGLKSGDIVLTVDGDEVGTPAALQKAIRAREAGAEVVIEYLRDGDRRKSEVKLGEAPVPMRLGKKLERHPGKSPRRLVRELTLGAERGYLGVMTQSLSEDLGEFFGVEGGEGALVSEVVEDSPAEKLGLKAGDVIVRVGDEDIDGPGALSEAVRGYEEETEVEFAWVRDKKERKGSVTLEIREGRTPRVFSWSSDDGDEVLELEGLEDFDLDEHLGMLRHHADDGVHKMIRRIEIDSDDDEAMDEIRAELEKLRQELEELKSRGE